MTPLVSILIPAFNAAEWIAATIASALRQTWTRTEIIVVDDGSTDGTPDVARRTGGSRVTVVSTPNQGPSGARNLALQLSQGEYIQWLDADDLLAPDKIERQMAAGAGARTLLSGPWGTFYYGTQRARCTPTALWHDLTPVEWLLANIGGNVFMPPMTWLTSRDLAQQAGAWDVGLRMDEDAEYFCRVLLRSAGTRFVPGAMSYYRMVPSAGRNSAMGRLPARKASKLRSMHLHIAYLRSLEDSERVRRACLAYLQTWVDDFFPDHPDAVDELHRLASDLGGELRPPCLRSKYQWLVPLIGYGTAKRTQMALPDARHHLSRHIDRVRTRMAHRGDHAI